MTILNRSVSLFDMAQSGNQPFVRKYDPSDRANAINVFRETADPSVQTEPVATIGSHIWCLPYLTLSPQTCFVLDDGSGHAVGYCIGTPDTEGFAQRWKAEFVPAIDRDLRNLPVPDGVSEDERQRLQGKKDELCDGIYNSPHGLVFGDYADQLKDYPGHLHIDILPSHQRMGFGKRLVDALLQSLKEAGCRGLYLGMVAGNSDAGRFYEREGFYRLPHVLDGGASGETGRTKVDGGGGGGVIYYVKDL